MEDEAVSPQVPPRKRPEDVPVEAEEPDGDQDGSVAKVKKDVLQPTRQQVQEHLVSNHAIFRDWCAICIAAQGLPKPHKRSWKTSEERAKEPDRLSSDYTL